MPHTPSFTLFLRLTRSIYFFLILLTLGICSYFFWDQPSALYMKDLVHIHPEWVLYGQWITHIGEGYAYFIGLPILYLFCRFIRKNPRCSTICIFLFSSLLVTGILGQIIKFLVGRYRPSMLFFHQQYGFHPFQLHSTEFSFPSGHTLVITSLMVGLSCIWSRYWGLFMMIALIVGSSRVLVTAHYPTDILGGMYLALLVVPWIYDRWFKNSLRIRTR